MKLPNGATIRAIVGIPPALRVEEIRVVNYPAKVVVHSILGVVAINVKYKNIPLWDIALNVATHPSGIRTSPKGRGTDRRSAPRSGIVGKRARA